MGEFNSVNCAWAIDEEKDMEGIVGLGNGQHSH